MSSRPDPPGFAAGSGGDDAGWLSLQLERLQEQLEALAETVARQQSVFVDIAGARTAELRSSLAQVESLASELRGETERMHELQDAISHHLHDLVLEVVQPELRNQLGDRVPELLARAMGPEMRQAMSDWLPEVMARNVGPQMEGILRKLVPTIIAETVQPEVQRVLAERLPAITAEAARPEIRRVLDERLPEVVASTVSPEVRALMSDWLPVMVADTVQPEVRAAMIERLPDIAAEVVQPEVRRILAERLPYLVAETVQPEVYRTLVERLPDAVAVSVTPELREVVSRQLPSVVAETVRPELRQALDERLPGMIAQVVSPEVRRVLAERLPTLVAETVQPEVRQTLTDRLPHLVSETVRPEVRQTLDERLPGIVAQVVSPEVRRLLAERLPSLVIETVQPELRQALAVRLPAIVAETVGPAVGALLVERVPGMLADAVTPELSVTLAEMEAATAELRQEAAKLRGLRDVIAERLPASVVSAIGPVMEDVLSVRFPRMVTDLVDPVVRSVLTQELPALVASAVQPDISRQLGAAIPELVAGTVQPELREIVARALEERLPEVVSDVVGPELREGIGAALPSVVADSVTPEVVAMVAARLPGFVGDAVTPTLAASLAEIEAGAAEMRAETARMRGLREVVAERLPEAVMGAVQSVLDESMVARLPELLGRIVEPAVKDAVGAPLPAALGELIEPALQRVLTRQLPSLVQQTFEREVELGLAESLPALVAGATEPSVRAALAGLDSAVAGIAESRQHVIDRLSDMARDAVAVPYDHFAESSALLRKEADHMAELRADVAQRLAALVEESVAIPLAEFESSATQLRVEAERFRTVRGELASDVSQMIVDAVDAAMQNLPPAPPSIAADEVPALVQGAVTAALADVESTAGELRVEADRIRALGEDVAANLPGLVAEALDPDVIRAAVEAALAGRTFAAAPAPPPAAAPAAEPAAPLPPPPPPATAPSSPPEPPVAATAAPQEQPSAQAASHALVSAGPAPPASSAPASSAPASSAPASSAPASSAPAAPVAPAPAEGPEAAPPAAAAAAEPSLAAAFAPARPSPPARQVETEPPEENSIACSLPGLVVGPSLAKGIEDAVNRARLRRRCRRRPGPPAAGLHRRDPFATELTRRLEWFALARRQAANGSLHDGASEPGTIPAGERDGHEIGIPVARTGGVCLVGPRAKEVARALVLTFLATNHSNQARVIVVGDLFPSSTTFPGLGRARDVTSLLGGLQTEAARRQAEFTKAGVNDIASYAVQRPDDPLPYVLVAVSGMTTLEAGRLGELLDDGPRVGILGVLVDAPLDGMLSVRLQGAARVAGATPEQYAPDLVGARLFTVDRDPGAELLDVLASARSDAEGEHETPPAEAPFEGVTTDAPVINVRLLGGFRIDVRGREIRAGLRAKAKELLAFYLLHPEGTTLEEATEALWPEADPRRGSEWFWTALGNLRSRLRSATENSDLKVIEREGDRYRIEPLFDVDLWRFESALAVAGAQSGDPSWAGALQDAAGLYSGELVAGSVWPWAEVPREDLRGRAVDVLVSLAAMRQRGGDVRGALDALENAVDIDPLAEQLYRRIMRLQAKLSRPDQADAAFRALVARLGEFDLHPSAESEKLHAELCGNGGSGNSGGGSPAS